MSLPVTVALLVSLHLSESSGSEIRTHDLQYRVHERCCDVQEETPTSYVAAVYEHDPYLALDPHRVRSRDSALQLMRKNLKVFEGQAREASKQGAQIIVFPEDGIYGMGFTRESVFPFLEKIPDPRVESWNPCLHPNLHSGTEVLQTLSCIARNNSIVLVANMGDKQNCSVEKDCPKDGHYQFNTDVAFNNEGLLLAKYHKYNLYYENQFDVPSKCERVTFTVFSVTFGMFTCFDILFKDPSVEVVEKLGVKNVVFPTAWVNALPLRDAIQYHQAWAMGENVNLLSANQHHAIFSMTGSGIYSGQSGALVYYRDSDWLSGGKLLIAEVPSDPACHKDENFCNKIVENEDTNDFFAQKLNKNAISQHLTKKRRSRFTDFVIEGTFQSKIEEDTYTFSPLSNGTGQVVVCDNTLCCQLDYTMSLKEGELYAFGAFDGLHTHQGQYYLQVCALVKCAADVHPSCGQAVTSAATAFSALHISGNFSTSYVYPEVTTDGVSLAPPSEWTYELQAISSTKGLSKPVLSAALYGRWYDRD